MASTSVEAAPGLHRDAVGLVPVLFQSVANMVPGAAVASSILFAAPYAGGATPLAVLIGFGLCLLVAVSIGQLARHLPSAGGLYTYNARGLGRGFGFLVGRAFLLAEVVVASGGLLMRTIPLAVFFSCLLIGVFYVVCYYGATVFIGPGHMPGFIGLNGGDPWPALATSVWGLGFIALTIALVNSSIAGANASAVATTRVGFALGRIRMLPKIMARVHPKLGTPPGSAASPSICGSGVQSSTCCCTG